MTITQFADVQDASPTPIPDDDPTRVLYEGYIRRAERSLAVLLLGPGWTMDGLSRFDADLVADTVADAVVRRAANPRGYSSETDGDYSYRLEKGVDGWWWPAEWRELFGLAATRPAPVGTIPVGLTCSWRGWAG